MIRGTRRRSQAGLTLLELVVTLVMSAVLMSAIAYAYAAMVDTKRTNDSREATVDRSDMMEREVTTLLQGARISSLTDASTNIANPPTTYFQAVNDGGQSASGGADRITFTTTAPGIPDASMYSQDDFETQQTNIGPVGGLAEVSLGTTAVGNPNGREGLFERIQRPSDGDPTQGGTEWDLDDQVDTIGFQFWDGTEWISTWDTTTQTATATQPIAIPQAVQVTYTLKNDPSATQHLFVVTIPSSTVTAQNPFTSGGTSQ